MKNKIVGYGEILLRLTPQDHGSLLEHTDTLQFAFAGAEANIIADLAVLNHQTQYVTALPRNPLGKSADRFLKQFGVATDTILWDQGRLGTYYIEHGTSIRGSRVTYDRRNSSITNTDISTKTWETIFEDAGYFILTGITPALSKVCQDTIANALKAAKNLGVKVVFDLNFRRTLWSKQEALRSFSSILPHVAILVGNIGSALDVFDIQTSKITDYESLVSATKEAATGLSNLGDFEALGMTLRLQQNASENILGGMIKNSEGSFFGKELPTRIADRLGGGDAFTAALLHGLINKWKPIEIINFATAAFSFTQTLKGDINYASEQDLLDIASGNTTGHVKR